MADITKMDAEEPSSGNPGFSLLSILRTIWKRKIRIGVAWALVSSCAAAVVHFLPAVYQAQSLVLIDSQKIPEKFVSATVASDLEDRISTIRQTLLSSGELKKMIDEYGLYAKERKTRFEEEILALMRRDISITLEPVGSGMESADGSSIKSMLKQAGQAVAFRIGYQGSDPELVTRVANRLTELYVDQNMKTRESQAAGTSEFLDTQLRQAKERLDTLEAAVSTYKLKHNGELPQQEQSLGSTLSRLQTELEVNRDAINRAQSSKTILEGNVTTLEANLGAQVRAWELSQKGSDPVGSVVLPGQTDKAPQRKTSEVMQENLEVLLGRVTESHPDVVRLKADIEKVKKLEAQRDAEKAKAKAEAEDLKSPSDAKSGTPPTSREPAEFGRARDQIAGVRTQIKGVENELAGRQAEQDRILHDLDSYQKRVERLPVREQEMLGITRDYEMSKANYASLLDKKMSAEMSLNMERRQQSERFTVLDRAQVPQKPIKPQRPKLYAGGAALGLALALLLGFAAELRGNVVLGEWELPKGTPVLARLPYIEVGILPAKEKPRSKRRRWFRRKKPLAASSVAALLLAMAAAHGPCWPMGLL